MPMGVGEVGEPRGLRSRLLVTHSEMQGPNELQDDQLPCTGGRRGGVEEVGCRGRGLVLEVRPLVGFHPELDDVLWPSLYGLYLCVLRYDSSALSPVSL